MLVYIELYDDVFESVEVRKKEKANRNNEKPPSLPNRKPKIPESLHKN
jgi:hypothetical protein